MALHKCIIKYLGDFCRQFRALAWKNKKLKLRSWIVLLLEIGIPTAVIFGLGFLRSVIKPQPHPEIVPKGSAGDGQVQPLRYTYDQAYCGGTSLLWRCTRYVDACFAYSQLLMSFMSSGERKWNYSEMGKVGSGHSEAPAIVP